MNDKDEIIRTREPGNDIPCRTCRFKLQPVVIMEHKVERFNYGTCNVFEDKPDDVLWKGAKCDFYQPE